VNDQAFTARFRFVPNGQNIAFVIQNSNNNPTFDGAEFSAGAGCEAGFFQGYNQSNPPNNVFALELDSYSPLTNGASFTYSSAQIYTSNPFVQCPCIGGAGICGTNNSDSGNITKISTSPVPLNSPSNSQNTTTGHTYSATLTYDGSNFTLNLYDVTAGGSCPGAKCFSHTWNNVDIPAWVSGNTAWMGFTAATGLTSNTRLYVESLVYNAVTPTSTLTPTQTATGGSLTIVSPSNGSTVSGAVTVRVTSRLSTTNDWWNSLAVDGVNTGLTDRGHYQQVIWNSATVAKGTHTLTVKAHQRTTGTVTATASVSIQHQ
jgi:hypothetical protein